MTSINTLIGNVNPVFIFDGLQQLQDQFLLRQTKQAWIALGSENYEIALSLSQVILDRTWEHLNTGHWKDVDTMWRYLYSFGSLIKSYSLYKIAKFKASLVACDMGLLMGAPIFDNILTKVAAILSNEPTVKEKSFIGKDSTGLKREETSPLKRLRLDIGDSNPNTSNVNNECTEGVKTDKDTDERTSTIERSMKDCFTIRKIEPPDLISFQQKYMHLECPVVIKNSFNHWLAMNDHRWTIEYLKFIAGSRTVPVEIGDKYTSENWTQKLLTVGEFIDTYIAPGKSTGYLAQHQLFEQIPELQDDIMIPDYCYLSCVENFKVLVHAWFGPKGTVSPLHHDPYHNLLAQVVGSKYIRLYDRRSSKFVYPNADSMLDNTSQVDIENVDEERFPDFHKAEYFECILEEGEMLYIPPKWWHFVKSLETSFSVSFWWK